MKYKKTKKLKKKITNLYKYLNIKLISLQKKIIKNKQRIKI
jgi:hypothetical protein